MRNAKKMYVLFMIVFLFSLLAGCGPQATTLTGTEKDAVLAFSEAKTDDLLAGISTNDYALFSKDFDEDMLKAITQSQFDALKKDRDDKLGPYVSRQVNTVLRQGDFYVVLYDAKFEKDAAVTMRVVFRAADFQ